MLKKIKPMRWLILVIGLVLSNPIYQVWASDDAEIKAGQEKAQNGPPREAIIDPEALKIQIPSIEWSEQMNSMESSGTGESQACTSCRKKLMDQRWSLRENCLSGGGDENSCNGSHYGETCCHCANSPESDPDCWDACDVECLWTEQCGEACGWESGQEQ